MVDRTNHTVIDIRLLEFVIDFHNNSAKIMLPVIYACQKLQNVDFYFNFGNLNGFTFFDSERQ